MTKAKTRAKDYEASLVAARKAGGESGQSHWLDRLKAVMKRKLNLAKNGKSKS